MKQVLLASLFSLLAPFVHSGESGLRIVTIVGTGGTDDFLTTFAEHAVKWSEAAKKGEAAFTLIGAEVGEEDSAEQLREAIATATEPELWIVLIGHGSFDSRSVKFNVQGPDFTDDDLAKWVELYQGDLAVINTASASGSFIGKLSAPGRIVITATKNETEVFYTRFGRYFVDAVEGLPEADLDNDEQVSLLECFLHASDRVANFYETEGRLATEHALIDDNGDRLGSRSEWFDGTSATRTPSKDAKPDGERAGQKVLVRNEFERRLTPAQRSRRDALEREVKELRRRKSELEEDTYYERLEKLLIDLARLYSEVGDS